MLEAYENLKALVAGIEDDLRKAAGGNKAAGTRVRKQMQEIKNAAQALRVKVLENRESDETPGSTPGGTPGAGGTQA